MKKTNKELNWEEFVGGKSILKSYPQKLGIDLYGKCNFKPACVYCDFDYAKKFEGKNAHLPFDKEFMKKLGPFFDKSSGLINCSIGEPFLSKNIQEVLETIEKKGKWLEMSTNGLLLTPKNRKAVLGKNISLYISLDAATKETFAKIRTPYFEQIIKNIKQLSKEKKKTGGWPKINLVFMPMKVNIKELEDFVKLCSDLKVDKMILRPLNANPPNKENKERGNYKFKYQEELIPFEDMIEVSKRAKKYADKYGVELANQLNFGFANINNPISKRKKDTPYKRPLCSEPWTNFYILRRGVSPCCYGYAPIAEMKDFKKIWNGLKLQNIRKNLAKGKLSSYCLKSNSCPITQKYSSKQKLDFIGRMELKLFGTLSYLSNQLGLQRFNKYFLRFIR